MPYTPSVQDRRGEIFAQGFSSLADLAETYKLKKEEVKKTAGELKAFGQTLEGLIKLGSLPESALVDYQNVLGADVKTQQGYLNGAVKSLNLVFEAERNAQAKAQSEASVAVNKAQLAQLKQEEDNNRIFTQSMGRLPTSVIGTDKISVQAAPKTPTADLNDFLYRGGKEVLVAPPFQSGMSPLMRSGSTQAPTSQPRSFDSSFGKTVPVIPPNELNGLVYPDTEKKKFEVLNDVANRLRNDQQKIIGETKTKISELQNLLDKGRQDVSMQVLDTGVAMPIPNIGKTPLTDSERAKALPQLTNAKAKLALQEAGLKDIETNIAAAEKFAGTPLTQKAIDPAVDPVIKILSLPNIIKRELKTIEVKTERPLTSDEKTSFVVTEFIKNGGKLSPKKLAEIKDVTKSDLQVFEVNGATVIKFGDSPIQVVKKGNVTNAALLKVQTRENYQKSISIAAQIGFNNLSDIDRATLSELHDEHGDKNTVTGARFPLQEVVANRAKNIYPGRLESADTFNKITPSPGPTIGGRFDIKVKAAAK